MSTKPRALLLLCGKMMADGFMSAPNSTERGDAQHHD
jgi:hypothetical protein